jgi:hypothetical protein
VCTASIISVKIIILMMEAIHTSETSVYSETTRRHILEGPHHQTYLGFTFYSRVGPLRVTNVEKQMLFEILALQNMLLVPNCALQSCRCFSGLYDILAASRLPHTVPIQELPQTAPQIQTTHCVLCHRYSSSGDCTHTANACCTHLCVSGSLR